MALEKSALINARSDGCDRPPVRERSVRSVFWFGVRRGLGLHLGQQLLEILPPAGGVEVRLLEFIASPASWLQPALTASRSAATVWSANFTPSSFVTPDFGSARNAAKSASARDHSN